MRYLTVSEVERDGHRPHLIHGGVVYSFRDRVNNQIVAHGTVAYEAAVLVVDMEKMTIAGPFQKYR